MPFVGEVGDAIETCGEVTVEWNIRDFFSLSDKADDYYESPVFSFAESRWNLHLYPNGEERKSSKGWLGLYLMREDRLQAKIIHCMFFIKEVEKEGRKERKFLKYTRQCSKFCSRSQLLKEASKLLPDNVLTITCHLKCRDPIPAKVSLSNRLWKVSLNMRKVLDEENRTDFTLKLGDRKWPVHKLILESRCEYFENMFRHQWLENTVGEVKFDDLDEDALSSVIDFIYTAEVEGMSVDNVCEIYVAAHKFLLDDLKALCIDFIKGNMCVYIVGKVSVIADRYDEEDLKECVIEYIIEEGDQIFDWEEWKEVEKNHSRIVIELLKEISKRLRKKRTEGDYGTYDRDDDTYDRDYDT